MTTFKPVLVELTAYITCYYIFVVCLFHTGCAKQYTLLVQCVTSDSQGKEAWMITERDTLEKTYIHVLSVRNVFHLGVDFVTIWIFIEVNTSAQNVADVVVLVVTWQHTDEVIQERNHLNVLFVADDFHRLDTLLDTAEFTVERNHITVMCVPRHLVFLKL